ncbi:Sugar transferase involved in LPS biosynthesis (colanic, teichoic acid) [Balnearium lithotrophicum]|uniref:Sugar transferase involved in LPS biosynthesis (Colanic, teichoic acid) n=2 Tax=Balnearium lithotrophicum TaxID=223788 RepID=A0A521C789_9BACT|nr:Sugar transferase involved in LPS biosynthesis (colanic, teichoic acid) [Balnearium lithotrophicum]
MLYQKYMKRLMDFTLSLIGLIFLFPFFTVIALLIKLEDGGSIFFRQERVGQNWKPFKIFKFRTMVENAEKLGALVTKGNDPRVTRIGKFLRKYKLDEFPQLINVLKGDMSLVGPRPEVYKYAEKYKDDYDQILKVKPGITDYAALEYIDEEKILENADNTEKVYIERVLPEKIEYYKKYLKNIGFFTDLKLILRTLLRIIR